MALTNPWIRPNIGSHFERENHREKEEKREEEEEEEKKMRRTREVQPRSKRYGTLELCMNLWDFCMDFYDFGRFVWIYGCGLRVVRNLTLE